MSVKEILSSICTKIAEIAKSARQKLKKSRGYVMILVAFALPVLFIGVQYIITKTQLGQKYLVRTNAINRLGDSIIRSYNPSVSLDSQKSIVYAAAANTLNDSAFKLFNKMLLEEADDTEDIQVYRRVASIPRGDKPYSRFLYEVSLNQLRNSKDPQIREMMDDEFASQRLLAGCNFIDAVQLEGNTYNITYFSSKSQVGQDPVSTEVFKKYKEDPNVLTIALDAKARAITGRSEKINREVVAHLPECNANIIIAIPTNHEMCCSETTSGTVVSDGTNSTRKLAAGVRVVTKLGDGVAPISIVAKACGEFLSNNFSNLYGITVGLIPYSGKVSLDPETATSRTCDVKAFQMPDIQATLRQIDENGKTIEQSGSDVSYAYWKQAAAYATVGVKGAVLDEAKESESGSIVDKIDNWKNNVGTGIMYRRGAEITWNKIRLYSGGNGGKGADCLLLDNSAPNSEPMKYLRMPVNPCYLGHCNLAGNLCEKSCPTYMENPYYIYELTDNIEEITYYLKFFVPFEDKYNKSNFIFLPLHWAGNLLSSWTKYPTGQNEKIAPPPRDKKKNFIVIIVNKPSTFEPHEMTYLGFDNDGAEMPISEADMIAFKQTAKTLNLAEVNAKTEWKSAKGLIKIEKANNDTTWDFRESEGGLYCNGTFKITFANKNLINLRVKDAISRVEILGDNRPSNSEHTGLHDLISDATFKFSGPKNFFIDNDASRGIIDSDTAGIGNYSTTGGKNFGHNLSLNKLRYRVEAAKVKDAVLSNQILRHYAHYKYNKKEEKKEEKAAVPDDAMPDIILNDSGHCIQQTNSTVAKYEDPCIDTEFSNGYAKDYSFVTKSPQFAQVKCYNFHPACYGVQNGAFIMTAYVPRDPNEIDISDGYVTQELASGWKRSSRKGGVVGPICSSSTNAYQVYLLEPNPKSRDHVRMFTGRFHDKAYCKLWPYEYYHGKYTVQIPYTYQVQEKRTKWEWKWVKHKVWFIPIWIYELVKTTYYVTVTKTGYRTANEEKREVTKKEPPIVNETLTYNTTRTFSLPVQNIIKTYCKEKYAYELIRCSISNIATRNVQALYRFNGYTPNEQDWDEGSSQSGSFDGDRAISKGQTVTVTLGGNLKGKIKLESQFYRKFKAFKNTSTVDILIGDKNMAYSSTWGWQNSSKDYYFYNYQDGKKTSKGYYGNLDNFKTINFRDNGNKSRAYNYPKYVKINDAISTDITTSGNNISYFGRGDTDVTVKTGELSFQYDLNNFFFVNTDKKYLRTSYNKNNLMRNDGIYYTETRSGGKTYGWMQFCGDGDLQVTFGPDPDSKFVNFTDIKDLDLREWGLNSSESIGESLCQNNKKRLITGETEIYVIPEQVVTYNPETKNYSLTVQISNCILREIGISNRPYYLVTPEVKILGALPAKSENINGGAEGDITMSIMRDNGANLANASNSEKLEKHEELIKISALKDTNRRGFAVFKTNVKKSFKVKAYVPIGWFDDDARLDWREDHTDENRKLTLYTNYSDQDIPVRLDVTSPYMGDLSPTLSIMDTRYLEGDGPFECVINSQHKLINATIKGFKQYLGRAYYGFTATYTPAYTATTTGGIGENKMVSYTSSAPEYKKMSSKFPMPYENGYTDSEGINWYGNLEGLDTTWNDEKWNDGKSDVQHLYGKEISGESGYDENVLKNLATTKLTEQYEQSVAEKKQAYEAAVTAFEKAKKAMEDSLNRNSDDAKSNISKAKTAYEGAVTLAVNEYNKGTKNAELIQTLRQWEPTEEYSYPEDQISQGNKGDSNNKNSTFISKIREAQKAYKEACKKDGVTDEEKANAKTTYQNSVDEAANELKDKKWITQDVNTWINWDPSSNYTYPGASWKHLYTIDRDFNAAIEKAQKDYKSIYDANQSPKADADKIKAYDAAMVAKNDAEKAYNAQKTTANTEVTQQWTNYSGFETSKKNVADKLAKIRFFNKNTTGDQYTDSSYCFSIGEGVDTATEGDAEEGENTNDANTIKNAEVVSDEFSDTKYERNLSGQYAYSDVWAKSYEALKIQHNYIKDCKLTYGLNDACNGVGESISGNLMISATPSHDRCDVSTATTSTESIYSQKNKAIFEVQETPTCQRKYLPVDYDLGKVNETDVGNMLGAVPYSVYEYIKDYTYSETTTKTEGSSPGGSDPGEASSGNVVTGDAGDITDTTDAELEEDTRPEAAYIDYDENGNQTGYRTPIVNVTNGELQEHKLGKDGVTLGTNEEAVELNPEPTQTILLSTAYKQEVPDGSDNKQLSSDDWGGAFGAYSYSGIKIPKGLFFLSVSGSTMYNGGTIDGISVPASGKPETVGDFNVPTTDDTNQGGNSSQGEAVESANQETTTVDEIKETVANYVDINPPTTENNGIYSKNLDIENCLIGARVEREGIVDTIIINQGHDANKTEIEISPSNYDFQDIGDGWYIVAVPCENVVLSDPEMLDTAKTLQIHGYDVGDAVQIIDYENRSSQLGAIEDDIRKEGSNSNWQYQQVAKSKYWCLQAGNISPDDTLDKLDLSPTSSRIHSNFIRSYIDTANNIVTTTNDFFAEFWDYDMNAPGLSVKFGECAPSKLTGTEYGDYDTLFSFSGSPLLFFPYNTFNIDNGETKFIFSGTGIPMAGIYAGFTMPYNFALANNGYQTANGRATVTPYPTAALQQLSKDACEKLKNTIVYVIKYGEAAEKVTELDDCSNVISYTVEDATQLNEVLQEIAKNIKDRASATSGYTEINQLHEKEAAN